MNSQVFKRLKLQRRHARVRAKVSGTAAKPRLSVYRSNQYIYGQLIDDVAGKTLVAVTDKGLKGATKRDRATEAGIKLAEAAKKAKIETVAFDRGGFLYKGRVQAFAEGAREGGLNF